MDINEIEILTNLRDILAELYITKEDSVRIVHDAGLDRRRIEFSSHAINNWHYILNRAIVEGKLDHLLSKVYKEFGQDNSNFEKIYNNYVDSVKKGVIFGRLPEARTSGQPNSLLDQLLTRVESTHRKLSENSLEPIKLRKISADADLLNKLYSFSSTEERFELLEAQPPVKRNIIEIFNDAKELLVLGEPGSGKSFTLWELTRELAEFAKSDRTSPVPVYLSLSSWTPKYSFTEWLARTIGDIYRFGYKPSFIDEWLRDDKLILLLDGLDEVENEHLTACVRAINQLRQEVGWAKIIVSCRTEIYQKLLDVRVNLNFSDTIIICPLTLIEIEQYLNKSKIGQIDHLQALLKHEAVLRTPLMLWVMSNIDDEGVEQLRTINDNVTAKTILFDAFIRHMLNRRRNIERFDTRDRQEGLGDSHDRALSWFFRSKTLISTWFEDQQPYTESIIKYRLQWLAQCMETSSKYFFIEKLPPTWLSKTDLKLYIFGSRIIAGILLAEIIAYGLEVTEFVHHPVIGLVGGLAISFIDYFRLVWFANDKMRKLSNIHRFLYGSFMTLLVSMLITLIFGIWLKDPPSDTVAFLSNSGLKLSFISIFFGLTFGVWGQNDNLSEDIQNIEKLHFSVKRFSYGFLSSGIPFSIFLVLLCWVVTQTKGSSGAWLLDRSQQLFERFGVYHYLGQPWSAISFGAIFGIFVGGTVSGTYLIISPQNTDERRSQKIQAIMQNNAGITLILSLFFGVIWGLVFLMLFKNADIEVILRSFRSGVTLGLISFFWQGGYDFIKHYWLRLILYGQGYLPLQGVDNFLDYCCSLIFLEKYPAYQFHHKYLQEHFSTLSIFKQDIAKANRDKIITAITCIVIILALIILVLNLVYPQLVFQIQAWRLPNAQYHEVVVSSENRYNNVYYEPISIITGRPVSPIKLVAGDYVRILAGGRLSTGPFVVRVDPNGSGAGILGIPIEKFYNRIPEFRNGALMFHIVGDQGGTHFVSNNTNEVDCKTYNNKQTGKTESWCLCGTKAQFTSAFTGTLEFEINDTEPIKHVGAFYVTVQVESVK